MANTEQPADTGSAESAALAAMEAKLFGGASEPEEPEAAPQDADAAEQETTTDEEEQPADETPHGSTEEEVEWDGKTYKVAPELKSALMRNADYTQKTQQIAEEKRHIALTSQRQQIELAVFNAVKGKLAELEAVKSQIEPYAKADLRSLDADQRRAVLDELTLLERRERALQAEVDKIKGDTESQIGQLRQKAVTSAYEILGKQVPGFSPGSPIETETARHALSVGIPTEQFIEATLFNPGFAVLAAQAAKYAQLQSKKGPALQSASKAPPVVKPGAVDPGMSAKMRNLNELKALKNAKSPHEARAIAEQRMSRFFER